jgi:hypothetical protein
VGWNRKRRAGGEAWNWHPPGWLCSVNCEASLHLWCLPKACVHCSGVCLRPVALQTCPSDKMIFSASSSPRMPQRQRTATRSHRMVVWRRLRYCRQPPCPVLHGRWQPATFEISRLLLGAEAINSSQRPIHRVFRCHVKAHAGPVAAERSQGLSSCSDQQWPAGCGLMGFCHFF